MIPTVIAPHPQPLPASGEAGWFHTIREKLKPVIKASPPVGERFGEGSKSMIQNEK